MEFGLFADGGMEGVCSVLIIGYHRGNWVIFWETETTVREIVNEGEVKCDIYICI